MCVTSLSRSSPRQRRLLPATTCGRRFFSDTLLFTARQSLCFDYRGPAARAIMQISLQLRLFLAPTFKLLHQELFTGLPDFSRNIDFQLLSRRCPGEHKFPNSFFRKRGLDEFVFNFLYFSPRAGLLNFCILNSAVVRLIIIGEGLLITGEFAFVQTVEPFY